MLEIILDFGENFEKSALCDIVRRKKLKNGKQ